MKDFWLLFLNVNSLWTTDLWHIYPKNPIREHYHLCPSFKISAPMLYPNKIDKNNINKWYTYVQILKKTVKGKFRTEYLDFCDHQCLRNSNKSKLEALSKSVVRIEGDFTCLYQRAIELFLERDGRVRLVKLKTCKGILLKPIQRECIP